MISSSSDWIDRSGCGERLRLRTGEVARSVAPDPPQEEREEGNEEDWAAKQSDESAEPRWQSKDADAPPAKVMMA